MITRFAPSPTGYLHVGHAQAAQEAFSFAQSRGGACLLRIEDIDHTRCRPDFTQAIYDDLTWLGFKWPAPVRVQSEHIDDYKAVIESLAARGLAYPCVKTRAEIKADMSARDLTIYSRDISQPLPKDSDGAAWRLSISACRDVLGDEFDALSFQEIGLSGIPEQQAAQAGQFGDVIIGRKDIGVSYHIAVTHDDALQGVTHIVRGADIKEQTGVHILLQRLMGWPQPIYYHHALRLREDGQKLAKRDSDPSIRSYRAAGLTPEELFDRLMEADDL